MIELSIFDMDGLLIDSEPFWQEAEKEVFVQVGLHLTQADMNTTMGRRIDEVVAHWFHKQPWEGPSQKDIEARIVDGVIARIRDRGVAKEGVVETLTFFKSRNIPAVVASSSYPEIIEAVLEKLNLEHFFVGYHSAIHEPFGKPHPGVFITAATEQGKHPRHCIVFEDSPSGVVAGLAASMKVVAVPAPEHQTEHRIQAATKVLKSLALFDESVFVELNS